MTQEKASPDRIRVLIVDDHSLVRIGIAAIIRASPGMIVAGQARTGEEALQFHAAHRPDITLMDLRLPGMGGATTIRAMRLIEPQARVIVITTYEGDEDIHQALQAGARGYITKGMSHNVLLNAITHVHAGGLYLPRAISQALAQRTPSSDLSARESEVLSLLVAGRSNREIGTALHITEATVKAHVGAILSRLNVEDRTQAVLVALQRGLAHL
jgi:two-component system, NarL family, response regulator